MKIEKTMSFKRLGVMISVLGLVVMVLGFGLATQPKMVETSALLRLIGLIVAALGGLGLVLASGQSLYGFSKTRQARYGANSILLTLSFIGVVILLNYLAFRHDLKLDLTEAKTFTLSEQTEKILKGLDKDIKVTAFYRTSNSTRQETLNRLESYRDKTAGKLKFEMVDPERQPGVALKYNINSDGTLVFESGTARKLVLANTEEELTSAVLAVTQNKPHAYFLTGHNELDPENFDQRLGLSNLKTLLEHENYLVAKLSLLATGKIPADASVLAIVGPDRALAQAEIKEIQDYLDKRQGKLLLLLSPRVKTGLEGLLQTYGVKVGDNIVVDPGRNIQHDITAPAFNEFAFHPITKELTRTAVVLPLVRSITLSNPPKQVQGLELMKSTALGWGETNLKENALVQKDPADQAGPLSVAVALTVGEQPVNPANPDARLPKKPHARMVVVGNAMFATNWFSRMFGNADFFMNSMAWLEEANNLLSIRAKAATDRSLVLTGAQETVVSYLSLAIVPGLMGLLGIWIWWRRR